MQSTPASAALGLNIAAYRKERGWPQYELAIKMSAKLGKVIDPSTITRLEQGKRPLVVHELIALGEIFAVDPAVLLSPDSPLDAAVAELEVEIGALRETIRRAESRYEQAREELDQLRHLRAYRKHRDPEDLAVGTFAVRRRSDWRELLLDAGVADDNITAALPGKYLVDLNEDEHHDATNTLAALQAKSDRGV